MFAPADDRHVRRAAHLALAREALHAGDGEGAGRLHQRARLVEDVLDRGGHLVDADQHDLVEQLAAEGEGVLADTLDRDAVGEQPDRGQRDRGVRGERGVHRGGVHRLDADDAHLGAQVLHVGADARGEPPAADRHEHRVERPGMLAAQLDGDGALPGDRVRRVEGMDEGVAARLAERQRVPERGVEVVAVQHHLAAERAHRVDLDRRRGHRHDDDGGDAERPRRERDPLGMVAGGGGDHAADVAPRGALVGEQDVDAVERAAALEREDALLVLALEQHRGAGAGGQQRRGVQPRLGTDVVDAGRQDALDVLLMEIVHAAARGIRSV